MSTRAAHLRLRHVPLATRIRMLPPVEIFVREHACVPEQPCPRARAIRCTTRDTARDSHQSRASCYDETNSLTFQEAHEVKHSKRSCALSLALRRRRGATLPRGLVRFSRCQFVNFVS